MINSNLPFDNSVYDDERLVSKFDKMQAVDEQDLVYRLEKRAEIRRQISSRKSVQEGKPDRIADLLEEAANEITRLQEPLHLVTSALDAAILALDDWINTYAPEFCDEVRVAEAKSRLYENGTLWYLANVVQQCSNAKESLK